MSCYDYDYSKKNAKNLVADIQEIKQKIIQLDILIAEMDNPEQMAVPLSSEVEKTPIQEFIFFEKIKVSKGIVSKELLYVSAVYSAVMDYYKKDFYKIVHSTILRVFQELLIPEKEQKVLEQQTKRLEKFNKPVAYRTVGSAVDGYNTLMACLRKFSDTMKTILKQEKTKETKAIMVGGMAVYNGGGYPQEIVERILKVLKEVQSKVSSHGFATIAKGDVIITKDIIKGDALAFYSSVEDKVFVQGSALSGKDTKLQGIILHELGHRYHTYKPASLKAINNLYERCKGSWDDYEEEPAWKALCSKMAPAKDSVFVVNDVTYTVLDPTPVMSLFVDKQKRLSLRVVIKPKRGKERTGLVSYFDYLDAEHGINPVDIGINTRGFVTSYARTSPTENFAEMFAFYCADRLQEKNKLLFEQCIAAS